MGHSPCHREASLPLPRSCREPRGRQAGPATRGPSGSLVRASATADQPLLPLSRTAPHVTLLVCGGAGGSCAPGLAGVALWGSCCRGGFLPSFPPSCPGSGRPPVGEVSHKLSFTLCGIFLNLEFKQLRVK